MSMLRSAWFIARKDVAYMLRQRETILWVFVMPVLFFYFIGTVTGGSADPTGSADRPDPLAMITEPGGGADAGVADGGFLLDELVRRLEEQDYEVVRPPTAEDAGRYARRLVLPEVPAGHADLTAAVLAGEQIALRIERSGDSLATLFDRVRISRAVYQVLADLAVATSEGAIAEGPAATRAVFERLAATPRSLTLRVESAGRRLVPPSGFEQAIPGTMVMFTMLVLLTSGAIMLVVEREQGLLRRLASTPISPGAVVLGKWSGRMALATVQLGFAMLTGSLLFGMNWGEALPMIFVVLFAWAAFNASLAILLANLARNEPQTAGIGVLSTMVLAALGGCWWPIEIAPDWMQKLALFLPTGWAMDAMHELISFGDPGPGALPHLAGLAVASLVVGWLAARRFRFS